MPPPTSADKIIAVSMKELALFGCPYCGYRSGSTPISNGETACWRCGECNKECCALAVGVTRSSIGFGSGDAETCHYPELQAHPRRGIPSHGKPDIRPGTGGEFFHSRGLGLDDTPGCFVCGGKKGLRPNIAAFVQCKDAGERVVTMFPQGARLDFRPHFPDRVQVKIGACDKHRSNLEKLHQLTAQRNVITADHIREAIAP